MVMTAQTIGAVMRRLEVYSRAPISLLVSGQDDMFRPGTPNAVAHYLGVGRSAIELIAHAMILAGRTEFGSVLDLPCGGGRVTRHLTAFLPDARLVIGDLNKPLEQFTAEAFNAEVLSVAPDFSERSPQQFDLIFVGSLLTHLDAGLFERALHWFIGALAPDGILVATTHGRRVDVTVLQGGGVVPGVWWYDIERDYLRTGFGYFPHGTTSAGSYGVNLCAPAWLMRQVQDQYQVRILGFQEAAWDNYQDAVILEKRPLAEPQRG